MIQETVNLYEHFGMPKGENARGNLHCMWMENLQQISMTRRRPGVLVIPGGGYACTSSREAEPIALRFLTQGYAAFILYYSVEPNTFPTALREAAMAMRYIRENAQRFHVDPDSVAAMGFSAGGHLCGTLGTMYDCSEVADIGPAELIRPDALGLCYPVLVEWGPTHEGTFQRISGGDPDLRRRLSLEMQARCDMPPVFLWHTRSDASVPCRNSILMAQALDEAGVDFALHIYRQGPHGVSNCDSSVYPAHKIPDISRDAPGWFTAMVEFFEDVGLRVKDLP